MQDNAFLKACILTKKSCGPEVEEGESVLLMKGKNHRDGWSVGLG